MPQRRVFLSYSHKDEVWKDRLLVHLEALEWENLLDPWEDQRIRAGSDWLPEIERALDSAALAVLLVSPDFLRSPFIREKEVPRLLKRRKDQGIHVLPILIRSCVWPEIGWLSAIEHRPRKKALAQFRGDNVDAELVKIAREILVLLRGTDEPVRSEPSAGSLSGEAQPDLPSSGVRPSPAPVHQLPPPPADFTGRKEDLRILRAAISRSDSVAAGLFGLRGAGGIGKTTLALKIAAEMAPSYPDGQIYLNLQGVTTPLSPAQAMAHVVTSFLPEAHLPTEPDGLAGRYRSVLHGRRVLLMMDNAANRDQVEPLVPPAGCALLVTSRIRFHLPGLEALNLDELSPAEAKELLRRQAPRLSEPEAEEIAQLCGHLPLALRLAGSKLAERPDLTPTDYARRLAASNARFEPVDAALAVSCDLLESAHRALWYQLAVFPGTFDAEAAAAVWTLGSDAAGDALGALVTASLIEWEDGRYRLHDLVRLFAGNRLEPGARRQAEQRHALHYLEALRRAGDSFKKGGEALIRGLKRFDLERVNIRTGQAWAAAHWTAEAEASALCSQYPDAGTYLLDLRFHPKEQIRWREAALEAARRQGDRTAEGRHLNNLGLAYAALGEPRRAIEHHEQSLDIARQIGDRRSEGNALGSLGNAYTALGEPRRATEPYGQWLAIAREIGHRRGEGNALGSLGNAYAALGELRRAIEHHEQSLVIARQIGDRRGEGSALGSLGIAYAALGEPRRAIEHYEQWLAIAREIGDRRSEGSALGSLGIAYAALGEPSRAIDHYEQSLAIAREIGDRSGEAIGSWNLGLSHEKEGDLERAAAALQVGVAYEREIGHPDAEKHAAYVADIRSRISPS